MKWLQWVTLFHAVDFYYTHSSTDPIFHQKYQERSRQDTQVILDSLPYRIMVVNMDMTVDAVNQTFLSDLQLKREDIEGKHCYEVRYGLHESCQESGRECFLEDQLEELKQPLEAVQMDELHGKTVKRKDKSAVVNVPKKLRKRLSKKRARRGFIRLWR